MFSAPVELPVPTQLIKEATNNQVMHSTSISSACRYLPGCSTPKLSHTGETLSSHQKDTLHQFERHRSVPPVNNPGFNFTSPFFKKRCTSCLPHIINVVL